MKLANPAPVGLFGFATTTWMLSMANAGWLPEGALMSLVLSMAFAYGGTAQFFAGLMEMVKGNTFGFVAFCSYGAFWWTFALFVHFFAAGIPATVAGADVGAAVGWYLIVWGAFTAAMMIGSFAGNKALQTIFVLLTITFFLLGFGKMFAVAALGTLGGYFGLATALAAFYLGAAEVINEMHDKEILPLGAKKA